MTPEEKIFRAFVAQELDDRFDCLVSEYRFNDTRRWRFDYAWPDAGIALEVEGEGGGADLERPNRRQRRSMGTRGTKRAEVSSVSELRNGFSAPINPMGKPRQTRSDKWKKRPAVVAYRAFADGLRHYAKGYVPADSGLVLEFGMPMPQSWSQSKKNRMDGEPHQQKPDIDNLIKSVLDALCDEDCTIWHIAGAQKRWSQTGYVSIREAA